MRCKYTTDEIDNFFEGNLSVESSGNIVEHIKECESCKVYYSSLVITKKLVNSKGYMKKNVFNQIEGKLDKNRYRGKKNLVYNLLYTLHSQSQFLKPIVAIVVICAIGLFAVSYRNEISRFIGGGNGETSISSQIGDSGDVQENINGGFSARLLINGINNEEISKEKLEQIKSIIDKRLTNLGLTRHHIKVDQISNSLSITAQWLDKKVPDFETKLKQLLQIGNFTFQEVDENKKDTTGLFLPTGKIICSNNDIVVAKKDSQKDLNNPISPNGAGTILIEFNEVGKTKFAEATERLIGKNIGIFFDDKLILAPTVQAQITDGRAMVQGDASLGDIAAIINSQALPANVELSQYKIIEPKVN